MVCAGSGCHQTQARVGRDGRGVQEATGQAPAPAPGLLFHVELPERSRPAGGDLPVKRSTSSISSSTLLQYVYLLCISKLPVVLFIVLAF